MEEDRANPGSCQQRTQMNEQVAHGTSKARAQHNQGHRGLSEVRTDLALGHQGASLKERSEKKEKHEEARRLEEGPRRAALSALGPAH